MKKAKKTDPQNNFDNSIIDSGVVQEPVGGYVTSNTATGRTISMMGMSGKKEFEAVKSENDFIGLIRTGIPRQAMTHLMNLTDLSLLEMASITHTSDRTLRRYKPQQRLSEGQSERILELAKLYSRGQEVFGGMQDFKIWMDSILLPFGNKRPKEFLDTSIGINMILDELGRIEHGIFA